MGNKKLSNINQRFDWIKSIHDIGWLILVDSLISTYLTRWFDLFNHNQWERKHCGRTWLIRAQDLQILKDSVHTLAHALNNLQLQLFGKRLVQMAIRGVDHTLGDNVCVSIAFGSAVVRGCVGRALVGVCIRLRGVWGGLWFSCGIAVFRWFSAGVGGEGRGFGLGGDWALGYNSLKFWDLLDLSKFPKWPKS